MFADPQSVTINAVANTLPRTSFGANQGNFAKDDGLVTLEISHRKSGKRNRRLIKLTHSKTTADPYVTGNSFQASMSVHLVADVPEVGYTNTEAKQIVDALTAFLTASSGAKVTQLLGGES